MHISHILTATLAMFTPYSDEDCEGCHRHILMEEHKNIRKKMSNHFLSFTNHGLMKTVHNEIINIFPIESYQIFGKAW